MSEDTSGSPGVWNPKVINGGSEKPKPEPPVAKAGSRPAWHVVEVKEDGPQTEFEVAHGTSKTKFKIIGNKQDAVGVVTALRLAERITRNSMRMALDVAVKGGLDPSTDPSISAYTKEESGKLEQFFQWLQISGSMLLSSGLRPWDGKYGAVDEGETTQGLALVKPVVEGSDGNPSQN